MSDSPITTTDAFAASVARPSSRGDWYAVVPRAAFATDDGNDATGAYAVVIGDGDNATVRVRFGGRGGAIIDATPDDGSRAALVVASVRAMRAVPRTYRNDARPGAIPSTVVAIATGTARNIRDGARIRRTLGGIAAAKRTARVPSVFAGAAKTLGTPDAFATPDVTPDA